MLNLKKDSKQLPAADIQLGKCPVCSSYVSHLYFMQDAETKKTSKWYSCSCGVVWNTERPNKVYDGKYWKKFDQFDRKLKDSFEYPVRVYSPIIEELMYGRKVLLVGTPTHHQEKAFADRGWIPYGIDRNISLESSERFFAEDFETFQFPSDLKFNMVWIQNTLECFHDPIEALRKCHELLTEDGILFLSSSDTDFIHTRGSCGFIHWKPDVHYLMWNLSSMTRHLDKLGFNAILTRQNYEHRFPYWDDFHIIAQKKFF